MVGLQEFVAETLTQIIRGVAAAQESASEHGAIVNPSGLSLSGANTALTRYADDTLEIPQDVSFDLAITTTEETKTKGGAAAFIGVVSLGTQGASDRSSESLSRIQFRVPIMLPMGGRVPQSPPRESMSLAQFKAQADSRGK